MLKNLVFLGFLALVLFLVVGWFQDWYSFSNGKNSSGKTSIEFDLDKEKIGQDLSKGKDKLDKTIDGLKEKNTQAPSASKPGDPWRWN